MAIVWEDIRDLLGWSDEYMNKLKEEYERVKEEEGYNERPRVRRIPEQ